MPIPETGPVSMQDISTEFSGNANPLSLSEYYAGGLYVPVGTTGNLGLIPAAGLITFDHFRGSSNQITLHNLTPEEVSPGNVSGMTADNTGVILNGNLVPQNFLGQLCRQVSHSVTGSSMTIGILGNNTPQAYWTDIVIGAQTLVSANADIYLPVGTQNDTLWIFNGIPTPPWTVNVDIPLTISYPEQHLLTPVEIVAGSNYGFQADPAGVPTFGNLVPQDFNGILCRGVLYSVGGQNIQISMVGENTPQAYWSSISIAGDTYYSASAAYNPTGPNNDTTWTFGGILSEPWINGTPIDLFITYP